jgi:hypothetical protein
LARASMAELDLFIVFVYTAGILAAGFWVRER